MYIDLHIHSHFSDGQYSPKEVILKAVDKDVSILSITDHNFLPKTKLTREYAEKNNIKFIEGIEISTLWRSSGSVISLHVLGYGKRLNDYLFNRNLTKTVNGYKHRALAIINKLNKEFPGLKIDFKLLKANNQEIYISRNTLARLLVEYLKNTISFKNALKQYIFTQEDNSWMMTPEESFKLIVSAGGIPVLAHSAKELRKMGLVEYEKMISHFVEAGLLGLEVCYPKHTTEEINIMKNIASKFNLYITGGSDWHGEIYTPDVEIGREFSVEDFIPFLSDKRINISV